MAEQVQLRRGTTAQHSTFTGAVGELTIDTTKKTGVVHDGSTAGGIPLAKEAAILTSLEVRDGTNAREALIYNTFTDGSNYERAAIGFSTLSNTLTIDTEAAGTGTVRGISVGNETFYVDPAENRVGIGLDTPYATLTVRSQGTSNTRGIAGEHSDNTTAFSQFKFVGRRSRGSHGSPSAVLANDTLVSFNGAGYKATGWSNTVGGLYVYARENWTDTATGTFITLRGPKPGTTTPQEWARFASDEAQLTPEWTDGATNYAALKINPTNTASGSDAKLLDLQVGGSSKASVGKGGDISTVSFAQFAQMTPPATPAEATCRIYAKDNGSGLTQLVVLMPDGVETVLATET